MLKKKSTQKNDSESERKGFEEMVTDLINNTKKKLGIEEMVVTTVRLDERRNFWSVYPSLYDDGCIVESGDLVLAVGSLRAAKSLIVALKYAVEMLENNED